MKAALFAIILIAGTAHSDWTVARTPRSAAELLAFKRANPCPSTGERRGSCPGWVIDHVEPLCAGGPDTRANMAWQEYRESLVKDVDERRLCRSLNR